MRSANAGRPGIGRFFGVGAAFAAGLILGSGAATAQNAASKLADDLIACTAIEQPDDRLACYDALANPLAGLEPDTQDQDVEVLFAFAGKDDSDTEVFDTTKPWRAVWQSDTSILTIELRDSTDDLVGTIGFQIGKGGGRSNVQPPGLYKLALRGSGAWRVKVVPAE